MRLLALLLGVPILELIVLNIVADGLGWPVTLVLLVLVSIIGTVMVRVAGRLAVLELAAELRAGRVPSQSLLSGAGLLVGAAFLMTPGFVTDALGFALLVRPVRTRMIGAIVRFILPTGLVSRTVVIPDADFTDSDPLAVKNGRNRVEDRVKNKPATSSDTDALHADVIAITRTPADGPTADALSEGDSPTDAPDA